MIMGDADYMLNAEANRVLGALVTEHYHSVELVASLAGTERAQAQWLLSGFVGRGQVEVAIDGGYRLTEQARAWQRARIFRHMTEPLYRQLPEELWPNDEFDDEFRHGA